MNPAQVVDEASGKSSRQVMQLLAKVDPELAGPADRVRPLSGGRWDLKAVIDDECRRGLERLQGLLFHVDPRLTLGQLMGRLVREGLARHDPARRAAPVKGADQTSAAKTQAASARGAAPAAKQEAGADSAAPSAAKVSAQAPAQPGDEAADRPDTSAPKTRRLDRQAAACAQPAAPPRTRTSAAKPGVTGRAIPAAVKREVWRRDRGRRRYVDRTSGRRCGS